MLRQLEHIPVRLNHRGTAHVVGSLSPLGRGSPGAFVARDASNSSKHALDHLDSYAAHPCPDPS